MSEPRMLTKAERREYEDLSVLIAEDAVKGRTLYEPWASRWRALREVRDAWLAWQVKRPRPRQPEVDTETREGGAG